MLTFRSSRPEVFCEKGVLRNFSKFTEKHLCQSLSFNKVAGGACNFIKKETLTQVFFCEFWQISKNTFFYKTPLVAASAPSTPNCPCTLFIRTNGSLDELGHWWFLVFLLVDLTSSWFKERLSLEKNMRLNFVGQRTQKCHRENRELRWRQIKSIYRLYLDLVVNQPCYINCLNA